ncbi:MAG: hypothetical protein O3A46_03375, partial [Candidatus Poribacteria bacterium]|nr:hypothetical protein [Candidatus Poribacteria bacterium]
MRPVLYGAIAFACLLSVVSAFAQDNASDDALLPEGVIVYVEQKPKTTRDGLASYLGVRRERYQPSQAIYDRFTFDLFTIDPDGSNRRQLTTDGMNERPRWSWDGEWIAYVNGPEPIQNLEVIRADGSSRKRLLENEQLIERFWWSHDSKKLLVAIGTR